MPGVAGNFVKETHNGEKRYILFLPKFCNKFVLYYLETSGFGSSKRSDMLVHDTSKMEFLGHLEVSKFGIIT